MTRSLHLTMSHSNLLSIIQGLAYSCHQMGQNRLNYQSLILALEYYRSLSLVTKEVLQNYFCSLGNNLMEYYP